MKPEQNYCGHLLTKPLITKKINFCYADFNGNIEIRLKEKHKEKPVYQIENMDKFTELMNDMTSVTNSK